MSVFGATVIGAVIGAVGAIVAGYLPPGGDKPAKSCAEKIRRAERREEGLLTLLADLRSVIPRFAALDIQVR